MPKPKGGIPDRWDKYSPSGKRIDGTPFVAFKVPLAERFFNSSHGREPPPEQAENDPSAPWTLDLLAQRHPDLEVQIDLTFTTKYYKEYDIRSRKVKYVKIFAKGHEIPDNNVVRKFFEAVDEALEINSDCLIGVHCTHGVNRTGYLICRYLIQKMKWEPEKAIQEFNHFRGHPIERDLYVNDLKAATWKNITFTKQMASGSGSSKSDRGRRSKQPQDRRSREPQDHRSRGPLNRRSRESHDQQDSYPHLSHHSQRSRPYPLPYKNINQGPSFFNNGPQYSSGWGAGAGGGYYPHPNSWNYGYFNGQGYYPDGSRYVPHNLPNYNWHRQEQPKRMKWSRGDHPQSRLSDVSHGQGDESQSSSREHRSRWNRDERHDHRRPNRQQDDRTSTRQQDDRTSTQRHNLRWNNDDQHQNAELSRDPSNLQNRADQNQDALRQDVLKIGDDDQKVSKRDHKLVSKQQDRVGKKFQ